MKKILLLFLLFFIVLGCISYIWIHGISKKIFVSQPNTVPQIDTVSKRLDSKKPIDVLLLGYGGGTHDGPYLTDSMIAIHIDPATQKIFFISIPRDIWVKILGDSKGATFGKINSAYAIGLDDTDYPNKESQFKGSGGGGKLAEYTVSQVIGLPIHYFIGIDFAGFTRTIDTLGGVDVNVETTFDDYGYPVEENAKLDCGHSADDIKVFSATVSAESQIWSYFPCRYEDLHFSAGMNHMDGKTALSFVRSRHSLQDGTDFGRAKRQRNLLLAVKQKILSIGFIPKIVPFITGLGDDARTDFSIDDINAFIQNASKLSGYQIISLALTDQNYLADSFSDDGQSILIPKEGINTWTAIHTWITDAINGKPEPAPAMVLIENGTKTPGLAQIATSKLQNKSVQTLVAKNADSTTPQTQVIVYDKNIRTVDMDIIKKEFSSGIIINREPTASTVGYNVLIIVGDDYKKN